MSCVERLGSIGGGLRGRGRDHGHMNAVFRQVQAHLCSLPTLQTRVLSAHFTHTCFKSFTSIDGSHCVACARTSAPLPYACADSTCQPSIRACMAPAALALNPLQ
eukprot:364201-Chlamydomonas_euryale.AAC.16